MDNIPITSPIANSIQGFMFKIQAKEKLSRIMLYVIAATNTNAMYKIVPFLFPKI